MTRDSSTLSKWKLTLTPTGLYSKVERDGVEVRDVTAVKVECAMGEITRVTLTQLAGSVEIDAEAEGVEKT